MRGPPELEWKGQDQRYVMETLRPQALQRVHNHARPHLAPATVKCYLANIYLMDRGGLQELGYEDGFDGGVDRSLRDHRSNPLRPWLFSGRRFNRL